MGNRARVRQVRQSRFCQMEELQPTRRANSGALGTVFGPKSPKNVNLSQNDPPFFRPSALKRARGRFCAPRGGAGLARTSPERRRGGRFDGDTYDSWRWPTLT